MVDGIKRIRILGVPVDVLTTSQAVSCVQKAMQERGPTKTIFAVNPRKVMSVEQAPALRDCLEEAYLLVPDGIGVVLAGKLLHRERLERVPGADLMQMICREAARGGPGIYLYGGREKANAEATERLEMCFPGLRIVGRSHGFLPESQMDELVGAIEDSGAEILFVALGSPKQEFWISKYLSRLRKIRICQGVGGTLDVLAGKRKRAPLLLQRLGLEWFFRLLDNPRRAWRLRVLPRFVLAVIRAKLSEGRRR